MTEQINPSRVYGAIVTFPQHPDATLHGEVRVIIRTRLFSQVIVAMARYGIDVLPRDLGRAWTISDSHAEHQATENLHGEVLACPIALAYLSPAAYELVPDILKKRPGK